jgi:alkylation response protein AidB-like acyl-CoA dehydrogenase
MVDMYIALEQAVSMTYMATLKLDRPADERIRAVSAAKVVVGKAARFVGQGAIQLHGGMGMTNELAVSHYFKRATMIESQLGSVDYHAARVEQCDAAA